MLFLISLTHLVMLTAAANKPVGPAKSTFTKLANWENSELASFVDMNADRRTDTVIYSRVNTSLYVLMEPNAKEAGRDITTAANHAPKRNFFIKLNDSSVPVRSVVAADFSGNSMIDFLILTDMPKNLIKVDILLGDKINTNESPLMHIGNFTAQPLVCDINGDMISDLYGELENGTRVVVLGGKVFSIKAYPKQKNRLSKSGYAGFAAIGLDKSPSIVVLMDSPKPELEVFSPVTPEVPELSIHKITLPADLQKAAQNHRLGKFVFGDFNMSSEVKLLLTGCPTVDCSESVVYLCSLTKDGTCDKIEVDWQPEGYTDSLPWKLAVTPPHSDDFFISELIGPSLGDADLDGYPDIAVGLSNGERTFPAVLRNLRGSKTSKGKISFKAHLLPGIELSVDQSLRQIAFFDQEEDGVLDLFISYTEQTSPSTGVTSALYVQQLPTEAYFLKVMMTSGLCGSPSYCPRGQLPYGLPTYGNRAGYETQGVDGRRIHSAGVFASTSCCGALQLPFITFGFADFATYIEAVPVSIPAPHGVTRSHELTFIVPNAQVVVIPYPPKNPSGWQSKLFLEPLYDMKVIYVAITLIVTCVILIVIVSVLQCLEMRSDRQEKLQEATRFHFDAM